MSIIEIIDATVTVLFAIAALTPTDKDDNVIARIKNLWSLIRRK